MQVTRFERQGGRLEAESRLQLDRNRHQLVAFQVVQGLLRQSCRPVQDDRDR
jgi:hypothetical protein